MFRLNIFDADGQARSADPKPNHQLRGVSAAGLYRGGWAFQSFDKETNTVGIGDRQQALVGSGGHLHLGESEVTGYWSGAHGGRGLMGQQVDGASIVGMIGDGDVTGEQCASALSALFGYAYREERNDKGERKWVCDNPESPDVVRSAGESKEGSGFVVDIHGRASKSGRGIPVIDVQLATDDGRTGSVQIKILKRERGSESGRLTEKGSCIMGLVDEGKSIALMVGRVVNNNMQCRWFDIAKVMRAQMAAGIPVEAPIGKAKVKLYGEVVEGEFAGAGRAKGLPFYLKHERGGTSKRRKSPNRPMYFSMPSIDRLLSTMSKEERASMSTDWMDFEPDFLPEWFGDVLL